MNTSLERQLKFVKRESATRLDPRARLISAFDLQRACFEDQGYKLKAGSRELAAGRDAALVIVKTVSMVDRLLTHFGPDVVDRRRLKRVVECLPSDYAEQDYLIGAMDFANQTVHDNVGEVRCGNIQSDRR